MSKQPTRTELVTALSDPWENFVKPFLHDSSLSSNVIAGHADVSGSMVRSLRNGTNDAPNSKTLALLCKFIINQKGIK